MVYLGYHKSSLSEKCRQEAKVERENRQKYPIVCSDDEFLPRYKPKPFSNYIQDVRLDYDEYERSSRDENWRNGIVPETCRVFTEGNDHPFQYALRYKSIPNGAVNVVCIGHPKGPIYMAEENMYGWAFKHPIKQGLRFDKFVRLHGLQVQCDCRGLENDFPLKMGSKIGVHDAWLFHDEFTRDEVEDILEQDYDERMWEYVNRISYKAVDKRIMLDDAKEKKERKKIIQEMIKEDLDEKSMEVSDDEDSDTEYLIPSGRFTWS